jgi:tetratricopeptide (TPR) repeat protein
MDLLDFSADEMYFDRPLPPAVSRLIDAASARYGEDCDDAERCLLRAQLLAPDNLTVLVALYRFYFYRQRYAETLAVADRCIVIAARELGIPTDWQALGAVELRHAVGQSMTLTRFLLLALKGAGYVLMRMDRPAEALARLERIADFDERDRLGLSELLSWARNAARRDEVRALGDNVRFIH